MESLTLFLLANDKLLLLQLFFELYASLGIELVRTKLKFLQSTTQALWFSHNLITALRHYRNEHQTDCDTTFLLLSYAYNKPRNITEGHLPLSLAINIWALMIRYMALKRERCTLEKNETIIPSQVEWKLLNWQYMFLCKVKVERVMNVSIIRRP